MRGKFSTGRTCVEATVTRYGASAGAAPESRPTRGKRGETQLL